MADPDGSVAQKEEPPAEGPLRWLPAVAAVGTLGALAFHYPAFANFAAQWSEIGAAGVSGDDFWAPLQFWFFFAAMHPLLQPALWISEARLRAYIPEEPISQAETRLSRPGGEWAVASCPRRSPRAPPAPQVLHASPGPQIGDVLPITFLLGNVVAIGALARLPQARTALNIALLGLFINYVGCGLEGTGGLGDYNLALDDGVKGCPTYEQVRGERRGRVRGRVAVGWPPELGAAHASSIHGIRRCAAHECSSWLPNPRHPHSPRLRRCDSRRRLTSTPISTPAAGEAARTPRPHTPPPRLTPTRRLPAVAARAIPTPRAPPPSAPSSQV